MSDHLRARFSETRAARVHAAVTAHTVQDSPFRKEGWMIICNFDFDEPYRA